MKRPTAYQFIRALSRAGIRYHSTGTITQQRGNAKFGEYYETDRLSPEQRETLKNEFGKWVEFKLSRPAYAPEQSAALIVHRSAGKLTPA